MDATIFDFFREVLLPRDPEVAGSVQPQHERREGYPPADATEGAERLRFAMKFQQYTGPLQAKGLEDTAFYRYNLLLSLNEVGGDPSRFGSSSTEFHELNRRRRVDWPYELLATSTHDTKLGEDVRARIDATFGDAGRVGSRGRALDAAEPRGAHHRGRRARTGSQRRVPLLPGAGRRVACRSRQGQGGPRRR